jgi:CRP-like cAMP-binding protein
MHPVQELSQLIAAYPEKLWGKPIALKRHEILIQQGQYHPVLYIVEAGALRAVLFQEQEEVTLRFGYKGSIVAALHCLYSNQTAQFTIQAIRKCVVRPLNWSSFQGFLAASEVHRRVHQKVMESLILEQNEREIDLLTSSPAERFKRLLERSPQVFQEVPNKYIANYLRMTPETLSRLMSKTSFD